MGGTGSVFRTTKRIKLGIWGLGRGMSFYKTLHALNFDAVAGCDYNEHMRRQFLEVNPGAFATADAEEFLAQDFDAVLLATFCPAHADDAIRCMERFVGTIADQTVAEELWRAIKGGGAFRRFKDTLDRYGMLKDGFRYRDEAARRFVIEWCEAHGVVYEDGTSRA